MARMIPDRLPDSVESHAERVLFAGFQEQLSNEYTILAGVTWLFPTQRGAGNGEADFIIIHPTQGILVLEVKGGRIVRDQSTGKWTSGNRHGDNEIKDPIEQARRNMYDLLGYLGRTRATSLLQPSIGHAVAFPDVDATGTNFGPDIVPQLILDATATDDLARWVKDALRYANADSSRPLSSADIRSIVDAISPSIDLRVSLTRAYRTEADEIKRLTDDQLRLLDFLNQHKRALIDGCAGSGKTVLAIEKARQLADAGFRTLLTCYNKALAVSIRTALDPMPDNLRVQHFHELAYDLIKEPGDTPPQMTADQSDYFANVLPEALIDVSERLQEHFDAIVVDEGQDFSDTYWLALESLFNHPDGIWYVFYDARQSIYMDGFHAPFEAVPFALTANLRNTQRIHESFSDSYEGITCIGPEGRPPLQLQVDDPLAELRRQLHRFLNEERISNRDIAILTGVSRQRSLLEDRKLLGNTCLTWSEPRQPNEVHVSTIHAFKGLERPVIIVVELENVSRHHDRQQLELVAFSRAVNELVVIERAPSPVS